MGSYHPVMIDIHLLTSRIRRQAPNAFMRVGVVRPGASYLLDTTVAGGRAP